MIAKKLEKQKEKLALEIVDQVKKFREDPDYEVCFFVCPKGTSFLVKGLQLNLWFIDGYRQVWKTAPFSWKEKTEEEMMTRARKEIDKIIESFLQAEQNTF